MIKNVKLSLEPDSNQWPRDVCNFPLQSPALPTELSRDWWSMLEKIWIFIFLFLNSRKFIIFSFAFRCLHALKKLNFMLIIHRYWNWITVVTSLLIILTAHCVRKIIRSKLNWSHVCSFVIQHTMGWICLQLQLLAKSLHLQKMCGGIEWQKPNAEYWKLYGFWPNTAAEAKCGI